VPEIRRFCAGVPILLVGLKMDLRNDPKTIAELGRIGQHPVTSAEVRYLFFLRNYLLMCGRALVSRRK
jgi:GTPase SAR1 family protein